jgi:hypothetical protein
MSNVIAGIRIWEELVVEYFKVLCINLLGVTVTNHISHHHCREAA